MTGIDRPQLVGGVETAEFPIVSLAEMAAQVDGQEPRWLLRSIWPEDAYGVLAGPDKGGKSWMALDLAVSVASCTPWLGVYPVDRPGAVLVFYGEGSQRRVLRRVRAIADSRDVTAERLPIRVATRVPHLTDQEHLAIVAAELAEHPAVLIIVDPLYLAARGSRGSDLYDMGGALEGVQHVCQEAGAALVVVTHFTKGGTGNGAQRITGVGPGAWGRVLVTAQVARRHTDPDGATDVTLGIELIGDEIPDTALRIRRRVWADDSDDLTSPLHYEVVALTDDEAPPENDQPDLRPAARRVLAVLTDDNEPLTVTDIGDRLAPEGPLKSRTIQDALRALSERDLADSTDTGPGTAARWWRTP